MKKIYSIYFLLGLFITAFYSCGEDLTPVGPDIAEITHFRNDGPYLFYENGKLKILEVTKENTLNIREESGLPAGLKLDVYSDDNQLLFQVPINKIENFERPAWDISFHVNMDAAALIGSDTFHDGRVTFRPGPVYCCAQSGGFGILDEINMARNEALAVLHSVLDFRRVIDVPGYDRIEVADDTRFIATMNYNYAGTRELNEALASRFVVIQMPPLAKEDLERLLKDQFPSLVTKYNKQFALLFNELQKKCENGELTEKALDLRGLIDAVSLIKKGIPIRDALDLGITNKIFDSYEKELIRDVIASRFPLKLHNTEVFE